MSRLRRPRFPLLTLRRAAAGLLAVTALVLALRPPPPAPDGPTPAASSPVTVAARDLAPGTLLTSADLSVVEFPAELVPAGIGDRPTDLLGRVLAGGLRAGEPVTDVRLVGPGLTASLPDGEVAAPVRLADVAVASLVRTGDRVDVLATGPEADLATVVAERALVLVAPGPPAADARPDPATGLLLLAVDGATASRLAAAATTATLTVSLSPP